jgi:hypothetical protein
VGNTETQTVDELSYKPEGRGIDPEEVIGFFN